MGISSSTFPHRLSISNVRFQKLQKSESHFYSTSIHDHPSGLSSSPLSLPSLSSQHFSYPSERQLSVSVYSFRKLFHTYPLLSLSSRYYRLFSGHNPLRICKLIRSFAGSDCLETNKNENPLAKDISFSTIYENRPEPLCILLSIWWLSRSGSRETGLGVAKFRVIVGSFSYTVTLLSHRLLVYCKLQDSV